MNEARAPRSARARRETLLALRFGAVGVLNSAFHAVVVLAIGGLLSGAPGFVVILTAWLVSIPVGYLTQATLVWRAALSWAGLARLAVSQVPSIGVSTGLSAIAGLLGWELFWQEVVALVSGAVTSYVLQRYWVFRRRDHTGHNPANRN